MREGFINYIPIKYVYKKSKTNTLLNANEFYKGRREILIAFEENIFLLPKLYVFGENEWKKKDIPFNEKFMPKTELSFLEKNYQTELSEKENEVLNRDFGYKNINELIFAFDNTKTDKELDELLDNIVKKLSTLTKLVKIVSNKTEKKKNT